MNDLSKVVIVGPCRVIAYMTCVSLLLTTWIQINLLNASIYLSIIQHHGLLLTFKYFLTHRYSFWIVLVPSTWKHGSVLAQKCHPADSEQISAFWCYILYTFKLNKNMRIDWWCTNTCLTNKNIISTKDVKCVKWKG